MLTENQGWDVCCGLDSPVTMTGRGRTAQACTKMLC